MAKRANARARATAEVLARAWQERDRLKETREPGVVDWGGSRRPECRYEAYWRGMSIGLFPSATEARAFLRGLDSYHRSTPSPSSQGTRQRPWAGNRRNGEDAGNGREHDPRRGD